MGENIFIQIKKKTAKSLIFNRFSLFIIWSWLKPHTFIFLSFAEKTPICHLWIFKNFHLSIFILGIWNKHALFSIVNGAPERPYKNPCHKNSVCWNTSEPVYWRPSNVTNHTTFLHEVSRPIYTLFFYYLIVIKLCQFQ